MNVPWKRIAFPLGLVFLPLVILLLLEGLVRLISPAPNLSLLVADSSRPGAVRLNPDVGYRYYPVPDWTGFGEDRSFYRNKPPGTLRILALGGSTTAGFPLFFAGSFPQMLGDLLNQKSLHDSVQVVNAGMTAVNSTTVLDLLPDCLSLEPDALVLYLGHNEFYGALGTATRLGFPGFRSSRFWTRLLLFLHHSRLYQLGYRWLHPPQAGSTLMARAFDQRPIPLSSPLVDETIRRFTDNLQAILARADAADVPVFLCTVTSNLKQPPFQSPSSRSLSSGTIRPAFLDSLPQTDPWRFYWQGEARLAAGDTIGCLHSWVRAREADGIRFRAPAEINDVIRRQERRGVTIVDIDSLFWGRPPGRWPGDSLFWEHVHPTWQGNLRIARFLAEKIRRHPRFRRQFDSSDWADATGRELQQWVTPLDQTAAALQIRLLTANPPFTARSGLSLADLVPHTPVERIALELLRKKTSYRQGHLRLAAAEQQAGDHETAVRECRVLIHQYPYDTELRKALASASLPSANHRRSYRILRRLTRDRPRDPWVLKWAGIFALEAGETDSARMWLRRSLAIQEDDQCRYNLAGAEARLGQVSRAVALLDTLLERNPAYPRARAFQHHLKRTLTVRP
ncbi:MAG: hypothetical protein D6762_04185 [Candidatus Neomarinimicrobiota bacterium]|nr:MAG: hypothetical protein D6762_04185 [Candidatus Neomarinimicrobiota bacterium]